MSPTRTQTTKIQQSSELPVVHLLSPQQKSTPEIFAIWERTQIGVRLILCVSRSRTEEDVYESFKHSNKDHAVNGCVPGGNRIDDRALPMRPSRKWCQQTALHTSFFRYVGQTEFKQPLRKID